MGVVFFHRLLVIVGGAFSALVAYWEISNYFKYKLTKDLIVGIVFFIFFVAIVFYYIFKVRFMDDKQ